MFTVVKAVFDEFNQDVFKTISNIKQEGATIIRLNVALYSTVTFV